MPHGLRLFLVALQFLTRVPVPLGAAWQPEWLQQCARHFPGVGLLVGGFGAGVLAGAAALWPLPVAVLLSMAATVWLTGAFHEDGLADTCDGLGGAVSREKALQIMKDSRIGTYGAAALLLVLLLKAALLLALAQVTLAVALVALPLAHAWSRGAAVLLLRLLPYAGDAGQAKAKPLAQGIATPGLAVAGLWMLLALVVAATWLPLPALLVALAALAMGVAGMARWLRRRLGGFTGDTLGAAQQLCELAIYLALLAALRHV